MTKEQLNFLKPILDTIENTDILNFAIKVISDLPPYIWEVGASSTGKYHPEYTLGKYGLMKHQIAVCRFINFFMELEQYNTKFTSREKDLLRVAALIHDGMKSGSQEDYEKSKYTVSNHPLLIANRIKEYNDLSELELDYIATVVSKHMGQWNTDKKDKNLCMPKPDDLASELLHLADYLASRKCLDMSFSDYNVPAIELPDINEYTLDFGKYKGMTLIDIQAINSKYIIWLSDNIRKEPLHSLVMNMIN